MVVIKFTVDEIVKKIGDAFEFTFPLTIIKDGYVGFCICTQDEYQTQNQQYRYRGIKSYQKLFLYALKQ